MPQHLSAIISLGMHLLALMLYSATMLPIPLYSFRHATVSLVFSLYACIDCDEPFSHMSPGCFENTLCSSFVKNGVCTLGVRLQLASDIYFYTSALCLLFLVLNLERLLALTHHRDYGHPLVMKLLIPIPVLAGTFALVCWLSLVRPGVSSDCGLTEAMEEPCVVMEPGAVLAILAYIASLSASVSLAVAVWFRNLEFDQGVTGIGTGTILAFTYRNWLLAKVTPILVVSLVFMAVSLSLPWVNFQQSDTFYRGDLRKMIDGLPEHREKKYECLWGWACANRMKSEDRMICNAFQRMSMAGGMYVGLEACAILFLILWCESLFYFLLCREFTFPFVVSTYAPLTVTLHVLAVLSWFISVQAKTGDDCQVSSQDTDISFCVDNGASFTIWEALCLFFAAVFYEILYCKRRSGAQRDASKEKLASDEVCSPISKVVTDGDALESPTNPVFIDEDLDKKPVKFEERMLEITSKLDITNAEITISDIAEMEEITRKPGTANSHSSSSYAKKATCISGDPVHNSDSEAVEEAKEAIELDLSGLSILKQAVLCSKCRRK